TLLYPHCFRIAGREGGQGVGTRSDFLRPDEIGSVQGNLLLRALPRAYRPLRFHPIGDGTAGRIVAREGANDSRPRIHSATWAWSSAKWRRVILGILVCGFHRLLGSLVGIFVRFLVVVLVHAFASTQQLPALIQLLGRQAEGLQEFEQLLIVGADVV